MTNSLESRQREAGWCCPINSISGMYGWPMTPPLVPVRQIEFRHKGTYSQYWDFETPGASPDHRAGLEYR